MTSNPTSTELRVADVVPVETDVERLAAGWVAPYDQVEHLMRARDWLVHLDPDVSVEMRLAAMTHDIERMFPGGPWPSYASSGWDDPFYLYAHQLRAAEAVTTWLGSTGELGSHVDVLEVRRLVGLHEVGGLRGADLVQAADSLSFLETLATLTCEWVRTGRSTRTSAQTKLRYMVDRIRVPAATEPAEVLFEQAVAMLEGAEAEIAVVGSPDAEVAR